MQEAKVNSSSFLPQECCSMIIDTAQKLKFSIKGFLRIWSHLLKKSLMEENEVTSTIGELTPDVPQTDQLTVTCHSKTDKNCSSRQR